MGASGLGKILLHEGLIGEKNLKIIEKTCQQAHAGIAKAILTIGLLDEEELASLLVERTQFKRIPRGFAAKAKRLEGQLGSASKPPSSYLALPFIEFLEVYPYDIHNGRLDVVTLDPMDYGVIHQVEFFSGHPVRPHIASLSELVELIRTLLPEFEPEEPNLQDFLIDYSLSSAQNLLKVAPPFEAGGAFSLPGPESVADLPVSPEPAPGPAAASEPPDFNGAELDGGAPDTTGQDDTDDPDLSHAAIDEAAKIDGEIHGDENVDGEQSTDLNQDVMDIFAEGEEDTERGDAPSAEELSRMGMADAPAGAEPAAEPAPAAAEPEPAAAEPELGNDEGAPADEPMAEESPALEPAVEASSEPSLDELELDEAVAKEPEPAAETPEPEASAAEPPLEVEPELAVEAVDSETALEVEPEPAEAEPAPELAAEPEGDPAIDELEMEVQAESEVEHDAADSEDTAAADVAAEADPLAELEAEDQPTPDLDDLELDALEGEDTPSAEVATEVTAEADPVAELEATPELDDLNVDDEPMAEVAAEAAQDAELELDALEGEDTPSAEVATEVTAEADPVAELEATPELDDLTVDDEPMAEVAAEAAQDAELEAEAQGQPELDELELDALDSEDSPAEEAAAEFAAEAAEQSAEAAAEPAPAFEAEPELDELASSGGEEPVAELSEETAPELAAEPALDLPVEDGAEELESLEQQDDELADALTPLDVADIPLDGAEATQEASAGPDELVEDITPADAADTPPAPAASSPVAGAVRALNEGLIKLSLDIGGETNDAAVATLVKIAPQGKIVRIGGSSKPQILDWQADGRYEVSESAEDTEVIDLVARRGENNALTDPKGWQTVEEATGKRHSTGYVHDDGQTGLYLVADIEDTFCADEAFSHLSKEFLKMWHQKWAG